MPIEKFKRKSIIVFGFEGKNNKTESNYFSHFKPKNDDYILKMFSCGVTDPANMIKSAKAKRKDLDYNPKEDLTFLFVDCDCDMKKSNLIDELQKKQGKDLTLIKSNPSFEVWFLNHFCNTTREFKNYNELEELLKKYLPKYQKTKDYFSILKSNLKSAIANSKKQLLNLPASTYTNVVILFETLLEIRKTD